MKRNSFIFLFLFLLLGSCAKQEIPDIEEAVKEMDQGGLDKEYDRGPVKLWLHLDKQEITIADKIILRLEALVDPAYEVEFPVINSELDQFSLSDIINYPDELSDSGAIKKTIAYELVPFLSGDYVVPSLTFRYRTGDEEYKLVQTDEIGVKVNSLIEGDGNEITLKPITGPEVPPEADNTLLIVLVMSGLFLILLGLYIFGQMRKKRLAREYVPMIPAHELAYRALENLIAKEYVEKGEVKRFYNEITGVLRNYIEDRFGLKAPERTTEEFLEDLRYSHSFDDGLKVLLNNFLNHADLVKFAAHIPVKEDIEETFNRCRNFIKDTMDDSVLVRETILPIQKEEGGFSL